MQSVHNDCSTAFFRVLFYFMVFHFVLVLFCSSQNFMKTNDYWYNYVLCYWMGLFFYEPEDDPLYVEKCRWIKHPNFVV